MANDKKFIVKNGLSAQNIDFVDNNFVKVITLNTDANALVVSSGDTELASFTDESSDIVFVVNDREGVPSIEVDDGTIRLAEFTGNVLIGTATDNGNKLQVSGTVSANNITITGAFSANNSIGTSGQVLRSDGTKAYWSADVVVVTVTSLTYTATATSGTTVLLCNTGSNNITVNLPSAVSNTATYEIKKINTSNSMIIDAFGTETIDGDQTITVVVENESLTLVSDGSNWRVV